MMRIYPRNEPCPARPRGLFHQTEPRSGPNCVMCGVVTADIVGRPLTPPIPQVRRIPAATSEPAPAMTPCENCDRVYELERRPPAGPRLCADCRADRKQAFFQREYRRGLLTEYPLVMRPLSQSKVPVVPHSSGSLDDWEAATIQIAVGPKK